jgi:hypothetical protein
MAFFRIAQRANGRRYLYEEVRWREGGRVRSRSRSLGPIDGGTRKRKRTSTGLLEFIEAQRLSPEERILASAAREAERIDQYQREQYGETARESAERERLEFLTKLHAAYGLKLGPARPTPVEPQRAPISADAKEVPAQGALPVEPASVGEPTSIDAVLENSE